MQEVQCANVSLAVESTGTSSQMYRWFDHHHPTPGICVLHSLEKTYEHQKHHIVFKILCKIGSHNHQIVGFMVNSFSINLSGHKIGHLFFAIISLVHLLKTYLFGLISCLIKLRVQVHFAAECYAKLATRFNFLVFALK